MRLKGTSCSAVILLFAVNVNAGQSLDATTGYEWMTQLSGEWQLAPEEQQEGKATKHKLVAPMIDTDHTAMAFKTIGKGSTMQDDLLPGNKKQMVTMYHCEDDECGRLSATHYCAKQNQPRLVANLEDSTTDKMVFDCDMSTDLCQSKSDHVHRITHELGNDGKQLRTTYVSWKGGKHLKESVYVFDRK